jgi:hypothetical protein
VLKGDTKLFSLGWQILNSPLSIIIEKGKYTVCSLLTAKVDLLSFGTLVNDSEAIWITFGTAEVARTFIIRYVGTLNFANFMMENVHSHSRHFLLQFVARSCSLTTHFCLVLH